MEMGQMNYDLLGWFVFFIGGLIGGALLRSRTVGRLEGECHRLREIANRQLREVVGLEKELWHERHHKVQNKPNMVDQLDGLRFRIRGIRGLPDSKVFRLRKR
jgi:hypothetical protein